MAEDERNNFDENEILKKLKAIGSDLWGAEAAAKTPAPAPGKKPVRTAKSAEERRPPITLDTLWMASDESVDWTEALGHETPPDRLTSPALWKFFHERAEKVLRGDVHAYAEVLRKLNPLGDLVTYADDLKMRVPSADRAEGEFTCSGELLEEKGQKYLCAMGLRIARDLLAALPVREVGVTAYNEGKKLMEVTYPREKLRRRNYLFLDPVAVADECGAVYPEGTDFGKKKK